MRLINVDLWRCHIVKLAQKFAMFFLPVCRYFWDVNLKLSTCSKCQHVPRQQGGGGRREVRRGDRVESWGARRDLHLFMQHNCKQCTLQSCLKSKGSICIAKLPPVLLPSPPLPCVGCTKWAAGHVAETLQLGRDAGNGKAPHGSSKAPAATASAKV